MLSGACPLLMSSQSACPLWTLGGDGALPLDDDQVGLMARGLKNITAPTMQSGRSA
jgi:hypothetical protein